MKRSKAISLILMGSLTLGASGCGSDRVDESMYTFTSLDECNTSGLFSDAECRELAKSALASRPRFSSLEECEAEFGEGVCQSAAGTTPGKNTASAQEGSNVSQSSRSSWMPMMMGFMAGRFLSGGSTMQGSQPLFRDSRSDPQQGSRAFRTAGGDSVRSDMKGKVSNPSPRLSQSLTHNAKPTVGRAGSGKSGGFSGGKGGGS